MTATVSNLIDRFISDCARPNMKAIGVTHLSALRQLQRFPIASKLAATLRKQDVIEFCQMRIATVLPSTVQQDITYLSGVLKYAGAAWDDCEGVSDKAITDARKFLVKYQLIGKSKPRSRIATEEETERLLAYFADPIRVAHMKIPMLDLIAFARISSRRRGEICRLRWGDIDWERKDDAGNPTPMYMIRDVKHPTRKKGNNKSFPLFQALADIIKRQPRNSDSPEERVFPFDPDSVTAAFCRAKNELGIKNLRWHDMRREAITYWLAKLKDPHLVRFISGHENSIILERVYDATDPATLHAVLRAAV